MKTIPLYGGEIQANVVGGFVKNGVAFTIIRPGYCIQGRRRPTWTQVVHGDVPVFEVRMQQASIAGITQKFDDRWDALIGADAQFASIVLEACKKARRARFKDGVTGEEFAPSITQGGKGRGTIYQT